MLQYLNCRRRGPFKLQARGMLGRCLLVAVKCPPRYYGVHFADANIQLAQIPQKVFAWLLQEDLSVSAAAEGVLLNHASAVNS